MYNSLLTVDLFMQLAWIQFFQTVQVSDKLMFTCILLISTFLSVKLSSYPSLVGLILVTVNITSNMNLETLWYLAKSAKVPWTSFLMVYADLALVTGIVFFYDVSVFYHYCKLYFGSHCITHVLC